MYKHFFRHAAIASWKVPVLDGVENSAANHFICNVASNTTAVLSSSRTKRFVAVTVIQRIVPIVAIQSAGNAL